jgi:hypothetical protein
MPKKSKIEYEIVFSDTDEDEGYDTVVEEEEVEIEEEVKEEPPAVADKPKKKKPKGFNLSGEPRKKIITSDARRAALCKGRQVRQANLKAKKDNKIKETLKDEIRRELLEEQAAKAAEEKPKKVKKTPKKKVQVIEESEEEEIIIKKTKAKRKPKVKTPINNVMSLKYARMLS